MDDYYGILRALLAGEDRSDLSVDDMMSARALATDVARRPLPTAIQARHDQYFHLPLPDDREVYISQFFTARGLESGVEVFPTDLTDWFFIHPEVQYTTGGVTPSFYIQSDGEVVHTVQRIGSVIMIPAGGRMNWLPKRDDPYTHIYAMNGPLYYDPLVVARLASLGLITGRETVDAVPDITLHDRTDDVTVTDWSQLLLVDPDAHRMLPTWLRFGWDRRRETRALDMHEGTHRFVVNAPDRDIDDFVPWGSGMTACTVNPLVTEPIGAITDCCLRAGWHDMLAESELWHVLRGRARITQSIPPLHGESVSHDVEPGHAISIAGGANTVVDDADDPFVVRRLTASCAHNHHVAMMERKLVADGTHTEL